MDADGYPDDSDIKRVREWDYKDHAGLMEFVRSIWQYADCGYWAEGEDEGDPVLLVSTAGWSGNEELIRALQENAMFWLMNFIQHRRGGHFIFKKPKAAAAYGDAQ